MIAPSGLLAATEPVVTVGSPEDGYVSTSRSVTVSGNATGSTSAWSTTSASDFSAGKNDNLTINSSGSLYIDRKLLDDFDDNSLDTNKWETTLANGISVVEENNVIHSFGKPTGSAWASSFLKSKNFVSYDVAANLTRYSGAGYSYTTGFWLMDANMNGIGMAIHYDWTWGYKALVVGYNVLGTYNGYRIQDLSSNATPRSFRLVYDTASSNSYWYTNGVLVYTYNGISMSNPKIWFQMATESSQSSIDVSWDDVTYPAMAGNFTSAVYDTRSVSPDLNRVNWTAATPGSTHAEVRFRSSADAGMAGATPWVQLTNGQTADLPAALRYIQVLVSLSRPDRTLTPVFEHLEVDYTNSIDRVEVSIDGRQSWTPASGKESWSADLVLAEDSNTVWVRAWDAVGRNSVTSIIVTVDTTPPSGGVVINNGAPYTTDQNVTLGFNATDRYGVAAMRAGETADLSGAAWMPYSATTMFRLSAGDGAKTVYAEFKDNNSLVSAAAAASIILDTTPPVGSLSIDNGSKYTNDRDVALALAPADKNGVASMAISGSPDFEEAEWQDLAPGLGWTLPAGDGPKVVYAKFRDSAGLVSATVNASIILDTTPPSGSILVNNGTAWTNGRQVVLALDSTDQNGVTSMMLGESRTFPAGTWLDYAPVHLWTLSESDGVKTVYAKFLDASGLESTVYNASITLDTVPPVAALSVNGGAPYTRDRNVTVAVAQNDTSPVPYMQVVEGDSSAITPATPWLPFQASYGLSFRVDEGTQAAAEGQKTVTARLKDAGGNVGNPVSATIVLDYKPPTTTVVLPATSPLANFTVSWSAVDATSGILYYDVQYKTGGSDWKDLVTRTNLTSTQFSGADLESYSFRARAQDRAGNLEDYPATAGSTIVVKLPEPVVKIAKPAPGASLKGTKTVSGTCQPVAGGRGVSRVEWTVDNRTWQTADGTLNWTFKLDTTKLADGKHVLKIRTNDGKHDSTIVEQPITVKNAEAKGFLGAPGLMTALAVCALGLAAAGMSRRRN